MWWSRGRARDISSSFFNCCHSSWAVAKGSCWPARKLRARSRGSITLLMCGRNHTAKKCEVRLPLSLPAFQSYIDFNKFIGMQTIHIPARVQSCCLAHLVGISMLALRLSTRALKWQLARLLMMREALHLAFADALHETALRPVHQQPQVVLVHAQLFADLVFAFLFHEQRSQELLVAQRQADNSPPHQFVDFRLQQEDIGRNARIRDLVVQQRIALVVAIALHQRVPAYRLHEAAESF